MTDPLASIRAELAALAAAGLKRRMRPVDGPQAAELVVDGRRALNFSSNNYLGLANHPALANAAFAATQQHGVGSGASRLIAGSLAPHRKLERELAAWLGAEAALLFNSGYQANVGIVSSLVGPEDAIFSDALNHASLIDGSRLSRAAVHVYAHHDTAALERALIQTDARRKLVLTESMFSMDGDVAKLGEIRRIASLHGAMMLVDDAHAIGALGVEGRGLAWGLDADLVVGTLGKAFGVAGAFVVGAAPVIELLIQRARSFIFSTAMPTAVSAAAGEALALVRGGEGELRRTLLRSRTEQLHAGLKDLGLRPAAPSHIQPIFVRGGEAADAMTVSESLLMRGLFVQGIRPPTVPRGTSRLRVSLMSSHKEAHVDSLLRGLSSVRESLVSANELGAA